MAWIVSGLISTALSIWAASYLAQRYHTALSAQIESALAKTSAAKFKAGQYDACVDAISRSCSMQWGKPCVSRTPKKSLFE